MLESFKQKVPESLKPPLRMLRMCLLRNPAREFKIKWMQKTALSKNYSPHSERLIFFFTPGFDFINGGILSISSLCIETLKLDYLHGAETLMCTLPGDPLLFKYTKFQNEHFMFSLSGVLTYFKSIESLLIHIPEYAVDQFITKCSSNDYLRLMKVKDLHINIMLQNIDLISSEHARALNGQKNLRRLTCTTAHKAYTTPEIEKRLGCTLHHFSTFVSPEQYNKIPYQRKENLIIVSPDEHYLKSRVLGLLAARFPNLKIQIINNLTYDEYKKLISRAKWALTFGEGLDGYFVEPVFSGGVSFAVYNDRFFTKDFANLRTVYPSIEVLIERIISDIEEMDEEAKFTYEQSKQFEICAKHYNYDEYIENLSSFYRRYYPSLSYDC
jgi:hypothetical protein